MDCPRCELPLERTDYEGVVVDLCQNCWGMWLDTGELEQILASHELEFSEEERNAILDVNLASHTGPVDPASCPRCGETMEQVHYDASVHLIIDRCKDHGFWFDTGEIKKVQAIAERSAEVHRMLLRKLGLLQRG